MLDNGCAFPLNITTAILGNPVLKHCKQHPKINPQIQNQGYTQNQNSQAMQKQKLKESPQSTESEARQNQKYTMHAIV
jgi:hypothetical protein